MSNLTRVNSFDVLKEDFKKLNRCILFSSEWDRNSDEIKKSIIESAISEEIFFYYNVDSDNSNDVCKKFTVMNIPTLIIFRNNFDFKKISGESKILEFLSFLEKKINEESINGIDLFFNSSN